MVTYKEAGVDIDAGSKFIDSIKCMVKTTFKPEVLTGIGGFSGLFSLNKEKFKKPVLVSSTDSVGTKLKIAFALNKHDTVGIDLVAMCVNDIIVCGAEPLFFLDYIATHTLDVEKMKTIVGGIVEGCIESGCSLIGGETAEMSDLYYPEEYDLAGFAVGIVDNDSIIDGSNITVGDKIIGIASNGLHSNGYTLARKIFFDSLKLTVHDTIEGLDTTIGEELLRPTKIYTKIIHNLIRDFHLSGIAHITGGGLIENIPRILPKGCKATLDKSSWEIPHVFHIIREHGHIDETEMLKTFNCGIGMVLIVPKSECEDILHRIEGLKEKAYVIGKIQKKKVEGEKSVKI
ncbi:MAG: phosphoribosylformylglycinamidine cyclo-ligase [Thermodesulfobacteriota bacterium]|nr:phosphoribosylformylglycinamidine cyclo-ligase [Thermodesulfobacteriota bacterium]